MMTRWSRPEYLLGPAPFNVMQNGQDDAPRPGGRRLPRNEAANGLQARPGWAPYVMIGGGLGVGMFVLAVAMFLKHAG